MKKFISIFIILISSSLSLEVYSSEESLSFYKSVFPKLTSTKTLEVKDTVSAHMNNKKILIALNGEKEIGFIRNINTTTGCNSACLPVVYSSFYDAKGIYIKLKSKPGLTKIFHAPFTQEDYGKLDFILAMAPKEFNSITDPKQMTDAISGETFKKYRDNVVKGAAYSTLRIHLYNQESLKYISEYLKKK